MAKRIIKYLSIALLIFLVLNLPVTTRQGVNYDLRILRIPLYIKASDFMSRSYWYCKMVGEIIERTDSDEERVMAIFNWVVKNIHNVPEGFDIVDDHVLSVIIRRYGTPDQKADVFTTLCIYAGIPAFWALQTPPEDKRRSIALSYILLNGKWRVFDVHRNISFLNNEGGLASVEDMVSDINIVRKHNVKMFQGIAYEDFFRSIKPIRKNFFSKEQKQVPLLRILFEIERLFKQRNMDSSNRYIVER